MELKTVTWVFFYWTPLNFALRLSVFLGHIFSSRFAFYCLVLFSPEPVSDSCHSDPNHRSESGRSRLFLTNRRLAGCVCIDLCVCVCVLECTPLLCLDSQTMTQGILFDNSSLTQANLKCMSVNYHPEVSLQCNSLHYCTHYTLCTSLRQHAHTVHVIVQHMDTGPGLLFWYSKCIMGLLICGFIVSISCLITTTTL